MARPRSPAPALSRWQTGWPPQVGPPPLRQPRPASSSWPGPPGSASWTVTALPDSVRATRQVVRDAWVQPRARGTRTTRTVAPLVLGCKRARPTWPMARGKREPDASTTCAYSSAPRSRYASSSSSPSSHRDEVQAAAISATRRVVGRVTDRIMRHQPVEAGAPSGGRHASQPPARISRTMHAWTVAEP